MERGGCGDVRLWILWIGACLFLGLIYFNGWRQAPLDAAAPQRMKLAWQQGSLILTVGDDAAGSEDVPAYIKPLLFEKIPVNNADSRLLQTIPGIGPELAARIIEAREKEGSFSSADDLLRVSGIGHKRKESLQEHINFD